jgi:hypothetical protein
MFSVSGIQNNASLHVVQAIEPLSPNDPIAMAFSILSCAFLAGGPVIPVELPGLDSGLDLLDTQRPHDLQHRQVDRARFGCAMCAKLAAESGMVNLKPEKELCGGYGI